MSSRPPRIELLDFARGMAMSGFVLHHALLVFFPETWLTYLAMVVGGGVHVFFFLSGFGLMLSSAATATPLAFFRHRFIKILIPYYLFITLIFGFNQWMPLYPQDGWYAWLGHILWFKIVDESIFTSFGFQFWSMSVIIAFYLSFPLLRALLRRLGEPRFFGLVFLMSLSYWMYLLAGDYTDSMVHTHFLLQYLWEFALGMVLACWYQRTGIAFWRQKLVWLLLLGIGGMGLKAVLALYGGAVGRALNDVPSAIGFAAMIVVLHHFALPVLREAFSWIGRLSFEFYLVHMLAIELVLVVVGGVWPAWLNLVMALGLALLLSLIYAKFAGAVVKRLMPPPSPRPGPATAS